ncbi:hypothetical protein [Streptomyces atratus]|uniref:hypothetical protein n=1 Tax=Streptomyces atratus TaxID=1893 RepID=UPI0013005A22|nr:hypothetical protein [Streptomyces atratus]
MCRGLGVSRSREAVGTSVDNAAALEPVEDAVGQYQHARGQAGPQLPGQGVLTRAGGPTGAAKTACLPHAGGPTTHAFDTADTGLGLLAAHDP